MKGTIRHLRIWKRNLNEREVQTLFEKANFHTNVIKVGDYIRVVDVLESTLQDIHVSRVNQVVNMKRGLGGKITEVEIELHGGDKVWLPADRIIAKVRD